ncbi:MAG: glutaredoxin family protein [Desulfarculaceae bacterium]|nr:glutaredoxin family protein [Desulfarculaceae bacterium]MCF8073814.1 glutaredoxin family protein [Desulfarculaceae bacterium]MCF8102794.1 glutaredoxin family protein [Desulfarculaceae bacterium]MCF8116238.1 glutaredoxin family protein [Desulfarculaceae bacterium]
MGAPQAVTIFKTPGCGRCRAAKEFFGARGFAVEGVDVTASISAKRRMARLAPGARVVPVIAYDDEVEVGWRPDYWKKRLGETT